MSGFERADWTDLIEAERMLAVGLSGAEIAVFARFSVQTNTLHVKKSEKDDVLTETHSGCFGFSPQKRSRVRHWLLE